VVSLNLAHPVHSCAEGTLGLTPLYLIQRRLSVDPKAVA